MNPRSGRKHSRRPMVAMLALALGAAFLGWWLWPREPVHAGRTLSDWLPDYAFGATNAPVAARAAVRAMGRDAVPHLVAKVTHRESASARWFRRIRDAQPWLASDEEPSYLKRLRAASALADVRDHAGGSAPELASALVRDGASPIPCAIALANLGGPGIAALLPLAAHTNSTVRHAALVGLRHARDAAPGVDRSLLRVLGESTRDPQWLVRLQAALNLGSLGLDPDESRRLLTGLFGDSHPRVRAAAVVATSRLGPAARPALGQIDALREDPDPAVRRAATMAARQIRRAETETAPAPRPAAASQSPVGNDLPGTLAPPVTPTGTTIPGRP